MSKLMSCGEVTASEVISGETLARLTLLRPFRYSSAPTKAAHTAATATTEPMTAAEVLEALPSELDRILERESADLEGRLEGPATIPEGDAEEGWRERREGHALG